MIYVSHHAILLKTNLRSRFSHTFEYVVIITKSKLHGTNFKLSENITPESGSITSLTDNTITVNFNRYRYNPCLTRHHKLRMAATKCYRGLGNHNFEKTFRKYKYISNRISDIKQTPCLENSLIELMRRNYNFYYGHNDYDALKIIKAIRD